MGSSWANHFVSSINYLTRPVGAAAPGCTAYFFLLENPGRGALPVPSPGPLVARGARAYDPRGAWVLRESGSAAGAVEPSPGCQRLGEDAARGQRWPGARKGGLGAGRPARSWDGAGRRQELERSFLKASTVTNSWNPVNQNRRVAGGQSRVTAALTQSPIGLSSGHQMTRTGSGLCKNEHVPAASPRPGIL